MCKRQWSVTWYRASSRRVSWFNAELEKKSSFDPELSLNVRDNVYEDFKKSSTMIMLTMIARISDGLPLAAAMQDDEQSGKSILEYQNQAKMLFRKLTPDSPPRCSIETGPYLFHYLIEHEVCYLILCERNYSKRMAYSYLEDIAQEFNSQYGHKFDRVTRPYTFIEFDTYLQKAKKTFSDGRSRRNMNTLNNQLQDVQRIMVQNIDDVLQRGTVLSELDSKTQNLSMLSQKYRKDAAHLNSKSMYIKAVAGMVAVLIFLLYFFIL